MTKKPPYRIYLSPDDDFNPVIEIGSEDSNGSIVATYFEDMSGEICLTDYDGEQLLFKDDGRLKHHIEYLQEGLEEQKKLFQRKLSLFKKAITLLKKEQAKFKKKKAKK